VGIEDDLFTRCVQKSSDNSDGSMSKLIAYQLLPKGQYYNIPKNNGTALDAFLDAAADAHENTPPTVVTAVPLTAPMLLLEMAPQGADGSLASIVVEANDKPPDGRGSAFLQGTADDGDEDADLSFDEEVTTMGDVTTQATTPGGASFLGNRVVPTRSPPKNAVVSVDFAEVDRSSVQSTPTTAASYKSCVNASSAIKLFLKELFVDVTGITPISVLRLNSRSNSRESGMMEFIKFMDTHKDSPLDKLHDEFVSSKFFQRLTVRWLIPFKKTDFTSIVPDGYCFYRALFQCLLRSYENYSTSLSTMQQQDRDLKMSSIDGGGSREAFFDFFARLEKLLPECYGKSRVMNAHMTFFNLKCGLDEAFWGVIDAVAFVDFNCTAFVFSKDRSLDGYWAQYKCSSVFAMDSRDLVIENMIGTAATFADVAQVVQEEPSYVILKNSHYFMTEHPRKQDIVAANEECTRQILSRMQRKICVAASFLFSENSLTLSDIYDRVIDRTSTDEDRRFIETATEAISGDLDEEAIDEQDEVTALLQLTESTAQKQSKEARKKTQKGDLAAACGNQAEFAGVIENLVRFLLH
jgi:hypothetical protein